MTPPNQAPYSSCEWDQLWLKHSAWWTQKLYADLVVTFARVTPSDALDGLSATAGDTLRVLVGKFGLANQDNVNIVLKRMSSALVVNDAVNVSIRHVDVNLSDPYFVSFDTLATAPVFVRARREIVIGDSFVVETPVGDFGPGRCSHD